MDPMPVPDQGFPETIVVQVDDEQAAEVDCTEIARAIWVTLQDAGQSQAEVTLVITGDEAVRALNAQYRGIDAPTDVLSFSAQEPAPGFIAPPEASQYLGDIIVALPFVKRQSEELGRALIDELRLMAVHGTLHLLGHDHADAQDEAAMWEIQDRILERLRT